MRQTFESAGTAATRILQPYISKCAYRNDNVLIKAIVLSAVCRMILTTEKRKGMSKIAREDSCGLETAASLADKLLDGAG